MPTLTQRSLTLPSGAIMPVLGQGTWHMAEGRRTADEEIAALRLGLDLGMALIDTAEMYADGASERLVGRAIEGRRDDVFLVSKVLPAHAATRRWSPAACGASLDRLGTDHLDLYLLHWRGSVPFAETVGAFEELRSRGWIRGWGVSNFDVLDLAQIAHAPGGGSVQTDQVLYNLMRRGIEYDLMPWCRRAGVPIMAYAPIEQGRLLNDPAVRRIAERHGGTPSQVALAWVLGHEDVAAIPMAGTRAHVRENAMALELVLDADDLRALDEAFPPPRGPLPLQML
jgi:diketogulonate reductase-like aldo/keto reductase